jgi:hypothetical protein
LERGKIAEKRQGAAAVQKLTEQRAPDNNLDIPG